MRHYLDRVISRMNNEYVSFPINNENIYAVLDAEDIEATYFVEDDMINSPQHYKSGGIECIDAIQAALTPEEFRGFLKGNAFKYLWREGKKNNALEDVQKSNWYISKLEEVTK